MLFADRAEAGRRLAALLLGRDLDAAVVLGLPRGGVVIARPVADALGAPLDILAVRKLGAPGNEEYAIGAIGEGGVRVVDERLLGLLGIRPESLAAIEEREAAELARRASAYRRGRERIPLSGRTAVIVDDGLATGSTAIAACRSARLFGARRIVVAVPVAPPDARERLAGETDDYAVLAEPEPFGSVGRFYRDFPPVSDEEVLTALER